MRKIVKFGGIGCGGLIGLLILLAIIGAATGKKQSAASPTASVSAAVSVSASSATPIAAVSLAPSVSSKPTAGATPTPQPITIPDPAKVKEITDDLGAANSFIQAKNWPAAIKEYDAALAAVSYTHMTLPTILRV